MVNLSYPNKYDFDFCDWGTTSGAFGSGFMGSKSPVLRLGAIHTYQRKGYGDTKSARVLVSCILSDYAKNPCTRHSMAAFWRNASLEYPRDRKHLAHDHTYWVLNNGERLPTTQVLDVVPM